MEAGIPCPTSPVLEAVSVVSVDLTDGPALPREMGGPHYHDRYLSVLSVGLLEVCYV